MTQSVLISGASIAGPALAYWLNRYGFAVTVVERAAGAAAAAARPSTSRAPPTSPCWSGWASSTRSAGAGPAAPTQTIVDGTASSSR